MNTSRGLDLEVVLTTWLEESASPHPATYLDAVLEKTARTRQRPAWTFPRRWLPGVDASRRFVAPRPVWTVVLLATILALVAASLAAQNLRRLPPPWGLARPGLVSFDTNFRIAVMNPDGTGVRVITNGPGADTSPVFSPDGTRIAFWHLSAERQWTIVVVDPAGTVIGRAAVQATGPPLLPLGDPGWASVDYALGSPGFLAWSPDSAMIAFSQQTAGTSGIWVVQADGSRLRRVGDPSLPAADPAWSPDGTRIAFHGGTRASVDNGIYVMKADGTDARRITRAYGLQFDNAFYYPQWQPGGELIAFHACPADSCPTDLMHIFVVGSDGTGERDISHAVPGDGTNDWIPRWSPDGTRIAYQHIANGVAQIVIEDPDGANMVVPPGQPTASIGGPMWSPDGRTVSALLYAADSYGLVTLDAVGSAPPRTATAAGNTGGTSWQRLAP